MSFHTQQTVTDLFVLFGGQCCLSIGVALMVDGLNGLDDKIAVHWMGRLMFCVECTSCVQKSHYVCVNLS